MTRYHPATRPTLYFIGVTTGQSSIMEVFPAWVEHLGLGDAAIAGIDFPLHADPAAYREAVAFIKNDPLSLGALVTTHKIDLFRACRDQFDEIDPYAELMEETSCLSKSGPRLVCHAKDPITAGLTLDGLVGWDYFARTAAEVFSMGAGGATIALTWHLMRRGRRADMPSRIVVSDRSPERLQAIKRIHEQIPSDVPLEYVLATRSTINDAVLARLKPRSLVINATGLGKDAPGSPLSDAAVFPEAAIAWDLNYRGDLLFLDQARRQSAARKLRIENGWSYFIHGWTQVIAQVFRIEIAPRGPAFNALSEIAIRAAKV